MAQERVKRIVRQVSPAFEDDVFDWDYETYLEIGGYGSGKSYHIATKIILKLLEEKRKCLVCRQVYDTIQESCFDLFCEQLDEMGLLTDDRYQYRKDRNKVLALKSPMRILFHNGSKIVFKGMDKPEKVKSINGVSIVWLEECSEITFEAYKELLGRIRTPHASMHFILSCNPIGKENWVYRHFFGYVDEKGNEVTILDDNRLYEQKVIVKNGVYYHHTLPTDNPWLPRAYLKRLDDMNTYDHYLYMVARWGRFGATGTRVLPQIVIPTRPTKFIKEIQALGPANQYFGMDFGFEDSYNAVISCSVDLKNGYLYIWDEIYINHVTDDKMANLPEMVALNERIKRYNEQGYNKSISADCEDPKAIAYYRQCGYVMRKCKKFPGSRLSNTRKMKRFRRIYISPKCKNTIRELKDLTYKKDKQGNIIYDEFNIDPHTFSALWYALDQVTVADVKEKEWNSKKG